MCGFHTIVHSIWMTPSLILIYPFTLPCVCVVGVFEMDAFAKGTYGVAATLAELTSKGCITIIGGGGETQCFPFSSPFPSFLHHSLLFFTIPFFSSSHRLRSRCREGRPSRQDVPHLYRYAHVTSTILIQNIYCACSFNFLLIHKCHCVWADVLIQPLYSNIIHGSYNFHTLYFHCHLL